MLNSVQELIDVGVLVRDETNKRFRAYNVDPKYVLLAQIDNGKELNIHYAVFEEFAFSGTGEDVWHMHSARERDIVRDDGFIECRVIIAVEAKFTPEE